MKKKSHPKFNVPNFGTKSRSRVPERWRKQRGIDNKKRIKKDFMGAEPTIGYRNPEKLQGVRVNGKRTMIVYNANDIKKMSAEMIKEFDVTIFHGVSIKKRIEITELANKSKIRVTNGAYK